MRIESARELKAELFRRAAQEVSARPGTITTRTAGFAPSSVSPLAIGIAVLPDGEYGVAVRYPLGTSAARGMTRRVVARALAEAGSEVDVRRTGRIRPLVAPMRRRAATAEQLRVRPLRPGVSIAHVDVTAGTLGAFVRRRGPAPPAAEVLALSNSHVLARSGLAASGDIVVQPGPADGGGAPGDRVGVLDTAVPLHAEAANTADAALALLDDPKVELSYPAGLLAGISGVLGSEEVEKVGRTTGTTRGLVTAIEVDDLVIDYGAPIGGLRFDGQIEVGGAGDGAFSRGGDSGSLVYLPATRQAVGLLFAGSETGGENGTGLTYLNPVDRVLETLAVDLMLER